jgi:hypothetical protein
LLHSELQLVKILIKKINDILKADKFLPVIEGKEKIEKK